MARTILHVLLALLLLADLGHSFVQHMNMPLDGDMAGGILPEAGVQLILNDPFGISVITDDAVYPNPNRVFAHWTFMEYFRHVPLWLQHFTDPIESVYLACALAKILIQIAIILLIAYYITGTGLPWKFDMLLTTVLITPFFQVNGYRTYMGIIDPSITYTFFYALPCLLLLIFLLPIYSDHHHGTTLITKKTTIILLAAMAVFTTFNGPLVPGVLLVITVIHTVLLIRLRSIAEWSKSDRYQFGILALASALSLYSLYIGMNNSIFVGEQMPILDRYARLPNGIFRVFTAKIGYPLLLITIVLNLFLLRRSADKPSRDRLFCLAGYIGAFALLYMLLLPLGGYKEYRPRIIRFDTVMPVTVALILLYGASTFILIKHFKGIARASYLTWIVAISLVLTIADGTGHGANSCEKEALRTLARAETPIVELEQDCPVVAWGKIEHPEETRANAQLFKLWNITDEEGLYHQPTLSP